MHGIPENRETVRFFLYSEHTPASYRQIRKGTQPKKLSALFVTAGEAA